MKLPPDEVKLSRDEGDALIERLEADRLNAEDRRVLVKLVQLYFWLTLALRETKISLKRLKAALFGKGHAARTLSGDDDKDDNDPTGGSGTGDERTTGDRSTTSSSAADKPSAPTDPAGGGGAGTRQGHGRASADTYTGAAQVVCRHDELAAGQRCPACGRGTLYRLPAGVEIRIDGNALLSAVRYELEKLRCSACGEIFTAPLPATAGDEKYSARARAVVALGRYYLGLPFYRLEGFQALVGVPVADATLWDQAERVADCAWPIFDQLKYLAAQSEVIFQDDTSVRILALMKENRQAAKAATGAGEPPTRVGMYTTGLVAREGARTIVLYLSGRHHAGENLAAVLARREPGLAKPIVMSDALSANTLADESGVIRCHCLAHGYRQFDDIDEVFPLECRRVLDDLAAVFEHEAQTRAQALTPAQRLAYHQAHSGPLLTALKDWLEQQVEHRLVEPSSSLGKAFSYLLSRWLSVTRFLQVPGAPLDNNTVERALKLMIRQRKNSLFFASAHSAYVASLISSVVATCAEAKVNALHYLVALQEHRSQVFANPAAWLPWNYTEQLAPG